MNYKRLQLALIVVLGLCVTMLFTLYVWRVARYERFSNQIAKADRVLVSDGGPKSLTITGDKVNEIIKAIALAHRDSGHYRAKFSFVTSFYRGTNYLGRVDICSDLFRANGHQYCAEDDALKTLIVIPFMNMVTGDEAN
jgi:hypothetical protein